MQKPDQTFAPFFPGFRALSVAIKNVHVALVIRGVRRSKRNLPNVTITHSWVLAFFPTRFLLLFRSHFCRNCSFTRRYQHDSVLELFPHFGRRTTVRSWKWRSRLQMMRQRKTIWNETWNYTTGKQRLLEKLWTLTRKWHQWRKIQCAYVLTCNRHSTHPSSQ